MSVATSHKNFVGGEWVDAVEEYTTVKHVMAKID